MAPRRRPYSIVAVGQGLKVRGARSTRRRPPRRRSPALAAKASCSANCAGCLPQWRQYVRAAAPSALMEGTRACLRRPLEQVLRQRGLPPPSRSICSPQAARTLPASRVQSRRPWIGSSLWRACTCAAQELLQGRAVRKAPSLGPPTLSCWVMVPCSAACRVELPPECRSRLARLPFAHVAEQLQSCAQLLHRQTGELRAESPLLRVQHPLAAPTHPLL